MQIQLHMQTLRKTQPKSPILSAIYDEEPHSGAPLTSYVDHINCPIQLTLLNHQIVVNLQ